MKTLMYILTVAVLMANSVSAHEPANDVWFDKLCSSKNHIDRQAIVRCELANSINTQLDSLVMLHSQIIGESTEAGEVTVFFNKPHGIKKVLITHYGEMGKVSFNYYYEKGSLLLINQELTHYDRPIYIEGSTVESVEKSAFLIKNDALIGKVTEKGHQEGSTDDDDETAMDAIFTVNKVLKSLPLPTKNQ